MSAITNTQRDELWRELGREPTAEELVRRYQPQKYASTARLVDVSMWHGRKPCRGGQCDEDELCDRHRRFDARRYARLVDHWRACCLCRSAPPCEESAGWVNRPCRDCWERVLGQPGVEPAGEVFEALKGTR